MFAGIPIVAKSFIPWRSSLPQENSLSRAIKRSRQAREKFQSLSLLSVMRACESVQKCNFAGERNSCGKLKRKGTGQVGLFWFNSMGFVGDLWVCGCVFLSGISRDAFSSHFVSEIICRQFWVLILVWHILIYLCIFFVWMHFYFFSVLKNRRSIWFFLFVWDFLLCYTLRW